RFGCTPKHLLVLSFTAEPEAPTEVEATSIPHSFNVKTARSRRGIVLFYAPRTGGAHDSHHRTAGVAGRTRRRGSRVATGGACAAGRARATDSSARFEALEFGPVAPRLPRRRACRRCCAR